MGNSRPRGAAPPGLARAHLVGAVLLTLLGLVGLWLKGPTPVVRGMTPQGTAVPLSYMVAAFPFFGILLADGWRLAQQRQWWATTVLAVQVLLLAILAVARLGLLVPISGHVFLLVFFVLWTAGQAPNPVRQAEWWLAWVALLSFLGIKLFVWGDWLSALMGALLGVVLWWAGRLLTQWPARASTHSSSPVAAAGFAPAQPQYGDDAHDDDDQRDSQTYP